MSRNFKNLTLQQFKVIQGHRSCQWKAHCVTFHWSLIVTLAVSVAVFEIHA